MGRLEFLLDRLLQRIGAYGIDINDQIEPAEASADSLGIDVITPSSTPSDQCENAPVLSLFDNAVVSAIRRRTQW